MATQASPARASEVPWPRLTRAGTAGSPRTTPVSSAIDIVMRPTTPVRRRGIPDRAAISVCTTTDHTDPGTYLPSWPTRKTPEALPSERGEPRSARTRRQPSMVRNGESNAATTASTQACGEMAPRWGATSSQLRQSTRLTAMTTTTRSTRRTASMRRLLSTSAPPERQPHESVCAAHLALVGSRRRGSAREQRGDVAVDVADERQAEGVGTRHDSPQVGREQRGGG